MRVAALRRYPVKSMLGEQLAAVGVTHEGIERDRGLALLDPVTGLVATAKHPRLWRALLTFSASAPAEQVLITPPDGDPMRADDPGLDARLSAALGRTVTLVSERPEGASVERPDPEEVLAHGVEAAVDAPTLAIGQGTTGRTFVDYAPVHLITTATLDEVGAELVRYRPNLVIETPPGTPPYLENDWVGHDLLIGGVLLRVAIPTPRCAVPTLEHGTLPRAPHAVRALLEHNRVEVPGFGVLPCAGAYAEVRSPGTMRTGDAVTVR